MHPSADAKDDLGTELVGAVAVSLYVVQTITRLAAAVDSQALALADGDAAPIAMTHVGLSIVLCPITGWAIVWLAWSFGQVWGGWRRGIAALGIVSGLLQAFSVPLTILLPNAEVSPVFAGAALSLAVFSILTGVVGASQKRRVAVPAAVASRSWLVPRLARRAFRRYALAVLDQRVHPGVLRLHQVDDGREVLRDPLEKERPQQSVLDRVVVVQGLSDERDVSATTAARARSPAATPQISPLVAWPLVASGSDQRAGIFRRCPLRSAMPGST